MVHPNRVGKMPTQDNEVVRPIWRTTGGPGKKLAVYVDQANLSDVRFQMMPDNNEPDPTYRFSPRHKFAGYAANPNQQAEQSGSDEIDPDSMSWPDIIWMLVESLLKLGLVVVVAAVISVLFILSVLGWGTPRRTYSNWSNIPK
jgi:hypothetical protein